MGERRRVLSAAGQGPRRRDGWAYRLPSEAEWEYACRAGTKTPFAFGEHLAFPKQAQFTLGSDEDGVGAGDPDAKPPALPERVGRLAENPWGLHDMHGNVAEWCGDWFARGYPADGPRENPRGPADGERRVVRGGSWRDPAAACRSAARRGLNPSAKEDAVGFRVAYAPAGR